MSNLQAICPHCGHENDYVFPYGLPKEDSELTCGLCFLKMPLLAKGKLNSNLFIGTCKCIKYEGGVMVQVCEYDNCKNK